MLLFYRYFLLFFTLSGMVPAQAQPAQKFQIAAAELSGLFDAPASSAQNQAQSGVYYQLLSQILQETGLASRYQLVVLPMKRAKADFARGLFACYAPGLDTFDAPERSLLSSELLSSTPFNYAMVKVISRPGAPLVKSAADVTTKDQISIVRGVPVSPQMQRILDNAQHFYTVGSELENLQMLMSGRVNYSLVFYPDVLAAYRELGLKEQFPYDQRYTPATIRDNLICHPEHKSAFAQIENAIQRYHKQGKLKMVLQEYYLPPELLP
ncbi:hypothetical protein [Rheinheimera sp. 4Y26]|uniref:hypothetical protein n=1 Tax=Rheinheimera sp. 4Y26 TaxID=2977811 RepID=UPI0021B0D805|nr:hypothetical protein [Rheinheimera sp. 4Y26]MCT6698632.1 hypothetical protein [Rheinheimera sp. 4Y26]